MQEGFRILEILVILGLPFHFRRDDFAGFDRRAVVNGDNPDRVGRVEYHLNAAGELVGLPDEVISAVADHHRTEAVHLHQLRQPVPVFLAVAFVDRPGIHAVLRDDDKQREVERVESFAQDRALTAALAAVGQESARILEGVALHHAAQGLRGGQRRSVAGVDVADLAFGDDHQRFDVDLELPREKAEMQTAAENVGLKSGFTP